MTVWHAPGAAQYASPSFAAREWTDGQRSILRFLEYLFVIVVVIICLNGWRALFVTGSEQTIQTLTEANPSFQIVSGSLYLIAALYLLANWTRFFALCRRNWPLVLLLAIIVASSVWSVYPVVTFRRATALVLTTGFGAYLALRFSPDEALKLVAWACGIAAVASLILTAVDPTFAINQGGTHEGAWQGIFAHKNRMGRSMSFGVLTFVAATFAVRPAFRPVMIAGALLCGALLILSQARTGWLTTAAVLMFTPLLVVLQPNRLSPAVRMLFVGIVTIAGLVALFATYQYILTAIGRDDTFSGRTHLWDMSIKSGMKHFMFGSGYRSFWTEEGASDILLYTSLGGGRGNLGNGHNGFLDTWLEIGTIGLATFLLVFFTGVRRVVRHLTRWPDPACVWLAMSLCYTFIYAWTEQILILQSEITWVMFVATLFWLTPIRLKARHSVPRAPSGADRPAASMAPGGHGAARGVAAVIPRARVGPRRQIGGR
jgi:exopolysaccharide production protein ExoQ